MTLDQIAFIRGIHGVDVNVIEIHEKDFLDKVCKRVEFKECWTFITLVIRSTQLFLISSNKLFL